MAATIRNPWKNKQTSGQQWARKVENTERDIADAERQIEFMQSQGLDTTSMVQFLNRLQKKLVKLNAE